MKDFEKLGAFYLGRVWDRGQDAPSDEPLLYDARDLTTHAVCVGMTGSGKTGLCIDLLEEAAIDGVPAIAVDLKGDLANLALTFPSLAPGDFEPWIDPGEAARAGRTPGEHAREMARIWKEGLAAWGQTPERIARFREAVDLAVYTPASTAGRPLNVLRSFAAPPPALLDDLEGLRERIGSAVSGLLALLGIEADPIRSREHILLSTILERAWRAGEDLDLAGLIRGVQSPGVERIGVLDLDAFYPPKDRFELAMSLNNLLASPGFAAWLAGEPLDVQRLLYTAEGRPRLSILSIAHLSERERMFFVTLLLNEVVSWTRAQPGTTSLRALVYLDEVFGYLPPTANPPSKRPLLTLLKQARAYGVGVVLATQNPVDLDYKALSNAGTWLLGRLQTERDKLRVLEGLEGTGVTWDRGEIDRILSGLGKRCFVMHDVHEDAPVLFQTRWALSYLRGPMTRTEIAALHERGLVSSASAPAAAPARSAPARPAAPAPPSFGSEIDQLFLAPDAPPPDGKAGAYRPVLLAETRVHFVKASRDVDVWKEETLVAELPEDGPAPRWDEALLLGTKSPAWSREPLGGFGWGAVPKEAEKKTTWSRWEKSLAAWLYRSRRLPLLEAPSLKLHGEPGETEEAFRIRVTQLARERRDQEVAKLEERYHKRFARLKDRIERAEEKVAREEDQLSYHKQSTAVSVGTTFLGALLGRKVLSRGNVSRAGSAVRGAGRISREREDVERAKESVSSLEHDLQDLEAEFEEKLERLREEHDPAEVEIETSPIAPRKADVSVVRLALLWIPSAPDEQGRDRPLVTLPVTGSAG